MPPPQTPGKSERTFAGRQHRGILRNTIIVPEWQKLVVISGCRHEETSADAYIDGDYQGAASWAFGRAMGLYPRGIPQEIHTAMLDILGKEVAALVAEGAAAMEELILLYQALPRDRALTEIDHAEILAEISAIRREAEKARQ